MCCPGRRIAAGFCATSIAPTARRIPIPTRALLRRMLHRLAEYGFIWRAGLEVEFHLLRYADRLPARGSHHDAGAAAAGHTAESRLPIFDRTALRRSRPVAGKVTRTSPGLGAAGALAGDRVRTEPGRGHVRRHLPAWTRPTRCCCSATRRSRSSRAKAILRASCAGRSLPHAASSGWHLHHSIEDAATGRNVFPDPDGLSPLRGAGWVACYAMQRRRQRSARRRSTATSAIGRTPWRRIMSSWAYDNRAAMVRVIGSAGDPATHFENRVGEPAQTRISTWRRRSPPAWTASRPAPIPVPRQTRRTALMRQRCHGPCWRRSRRS